MRFGNFLMRFHVLIEIYPVVPYPPSVREGVSDVTVRVLRWGGMTSAETVADIEPILWGRQITPAPYQNLSLIHI